MSFPSPRLPPGPLLRTGWRSGAAGAFRGPVLVGVTDFTAATPLDLPAITAAGFRLRRGWPGLEGAVGLWLWTRPLELRVGSVAVWTGDDALRGFVAWPPHVAIMRRFRGRGALRSVTWEADRTDRAEAWARAAAMLASWPPAGQADAGTSSQTVPR